MRLPKSAASFIVVALASIAVQAAAIHFGLWTEFEARSWDWRAKLIAHKEQADSRIKIIAIDQTSLDFYDKEEFIRWPWPRALYVPIIKFLEKAGAKAVAFDMLYTEPSVSGVEDDREFGEALKSSVATISAGSHDMSARTIDEDKLALLREKQAAAAKALQFDDFFVRDGEPARYSSGTLPIADILAHTTAIGMVDAEPDSDGIFRSYDPAAYLSNIPVLGLPIAMYAQVTPHPQDRLRLGDFLDRNGKLTVRFHGPAGTYHSERFANIVLSYNELMKGGTPAVKLDDWKDSLVFVGILGAKGLGDLRPTPLSKEFWGVEYNATVLDNLLHQNFIKKVSPLHNNLLGSIFIIGIAAVGIFLKHLRSQVPLFIVIYALFTWTAYSFALSGYWIAFVLPILGMNTALLSSLGYQYATEGRQHRFIKNAFMHYVSPSVINKIVDNPSALALGGERRELTMFFSDIEGFTTLSETLEATKLVTLLNQYLTAMTDIILSTGGTLDKYEGDAIIAFWNAPLNVENHQQAGVRAALACQAQLASMNDQFQKEYGVNLRMRIGIHTGMVSVGNFGSRDRFDYTIIGDAANLTARLEGVNKVFGTYTMISEATKAGIGPDIVCRKIGAIKVVGKNKSVAVFEPLSPDAAQAKQQLLVDYHAALAFFEQSEFDKAIELFRKIDDPVAKAYVARIQKESLAFYDESAWSPVWALTSK